MKNKKDLTDEEIKNEPLSEVDLEFIKQISSELDNDDIIDKDKYVLRALISGKDEIVFKTDLAINQIKAIIQLRMADDIFKNQSASLKDFDLAIEKQKNISYNMTDMLMQLLVSKNRLGRMELIDAYKGQVEPEQRGGLFSRFFKGR